MTSKINPDRYKQDAVVEKKGMRADFAAGDAEWKTGGFYRAGAEPVTMEQKIAEEEARVAALEEQKRQLQERLAAYKAKANVKP